MFSDREAARRVVVEFLHRGYGNNYWDDMIGIPAKGPHGCVLQFLNAGISQSRWPELGFVIGRVLRQKYPNGKRRWNAQNWPEEVEPILDLIDQVATEYTATEAPQFTVVEPDYEPPTGPLSNGFVPWRLFRKRNPVPATAGVYVFAYFDGVPDAFVDLGSDRVIYIGYTGHEKNRRFLYQRLDEFEQTALGELGHSAGWTYRTEFAADSASLQLFRCTYISWRSFAPGERPTAHQFETAAIEDYRKRWGERPFLNRRA